MSNPWHLIADIGGTNARFAAFRCNHLLASTTYETGHGESLLSMARRFCQSLSEPPDIAVVAAAGPVSNNAVRLTNADQFLCGEELRAATGARQAHVINDFAAAAWAMLEVNPDDLSRISGAIHPTSGTRLVIGPGTGLGVGALTCHHGRWKAIVGEGGHIGISPRNRFEAEAFEALRTRWPDVAFGDTLTLEAEAILSGTGLPILYRAVQDVKGVCTTDIQPDTIFKTARTGVDPIAETVVTVFKAHLAQIAGDLGLVFGAEGGIFFTGGIALKNPWLFDDGFVSHMQAGGRFTPQRTALNLYLFQRPDFGLLGARNYARHALSE